ncbi:hypothetical protein Droror1_Dr00003265 [Drosera rotundifolia]
MLCSPTTTHSHLTNSPRKKTTSFLNPTSSISFMTRWVRTVPKMIPPDQNLRKLRMKNNKNPKRFGNTHLQGLVTSGELESGLEFLEKMVLGGVDITDVDSWATMIHGFCKIGETTRTVVENWLRKLC